MLIKVNDRTGRATDSLPLLYEADQKHHNRNAGGEQYFIIAGPPTLLASEFLRKGILRFTQGYQFPV